LARSAQEGPTGVVMGRGGPALEACRLFTAARIARGQWACRSRTDAHRQGNASCLVQAYDPNCIRPCWSLTADAGMNQGGRYGCRLDDAGPVLLRRSGKPPWCWPTRTEQPRWIRDRGPVAPSAIRLPSSTFILSRSQPGRGCAHARSAIDGWIFSRRWRCPPQSEITLTRAFAPTRVIGSDPNIEGMEVAEIRASCLYEAETAHVQSRCLATGTPERCRPDGVRASQNWQGKWGGGT